MNYFQKENRISVQHYFNSSFLCKSVVGKHIIDTFVFMVYYEFTFLNNLHSFLRFSPVPIFCLI